MTTLVLLEFDPATNRIKQPSRSAVAAALQMGDVHGLVVGSDCAAAAKAAAQLPKISRVLQADSAIYDHVRAEPLAALIVALAGEYSHIVAASTATGKNVLPRVAALLDVQPISDVIGIQSADTFLRPIYAGNAIATVKSTDRIKVMTVRAASFDPVAETGSAAPVFPASAQPDFDRSRFVSTALTTSARPELSASRVVISGGRGLGSADNFKLLDKIADHLGAAIGATRAAVDAGYAPNDQQIGQTGKVVAPDLYIAVGISGAIQHLAGMKDSKVIVAINKDEDAPIFQVADYGLVADLFTAIPELEAALSA